MICTYGRAKVMKATEVRLFHKLITDVERTLPGLAVVSWFI